MSMSSSAACKTLDFDVVKDLERNCDTACLEPLNIFSHVWQYRGEGNANVVVALQDDLRVIRLSKVNVGEPVGDLKKHRRKVEREVIFASRVFGLLIGSEFVGSVKAVILSQEQISRLNDLLGNVRPMYRRHKEIRVPYATSHSDFARIHRYPSSQSDYCIEIKPKQGWWPNSMKMKIGDLPSLCTYCLNQFLKLKRAKISSRTSYCPLDLFSGNPQRMIAAVTSLIANPQNNFRIFCDGKLVYGECKEESLEAILGKWLGNNERTASIYNAADLPSTINSFVYLLCMSLLKPKCSPGKSKYPGNNSFNVITRQLHKILSHTPPSHLYSQILAKSPPMSKGSTIGGNTIGKENLGVSCNDEAFALPEGCILSRILEIQKLVECQKSGIKGDPSIYKIYQKICPVHNCKGKGISSHIPQNSSFVKSLAQLNAQPILNVVLAEDDDSDDNFASSSENERLSDAESFEECFDTSSTEEDEDTLTMGLKFEDLKEPVFDSHTFECPGPSCLGAEKWLDEIENLPLSEQETQSMELYLLAATAKDCSIMVTFSPTEDFSEQTNNSESNSCFYKDTDLLIDDLNKKTHRVRIGVADLDPKPVTTIVRHYLRDNEMLQAYETCCNA
ncbi:unnamed protein product [Orchesella dallaii]|uniref:Inositol-pentakisphosphate 2-kinase n=1 Tax=Orchesella dallaii TaxID=48710 RepID=A0ABP1PUA7_9HEXA